MRNPNEDKMAIRENMAEDSSSEDDVPTTAEEGKDRGYIAKKKIQGYQGVKMPGNVGVNLKRERDTLSSQYKLTDLD
jgi:hypothetical protein